MAEVLITQAQRLLESCQNYLIEPDRLVDALNELIREVLCFLMKIVFAIASLYYAELGISNALSKRITASKLEISKEKIDEAIQQTEEKFEIQYDASQKEAIYRIMTEPLLY